MLGHRHITRHGALAAIAMLGLVATLAYACGGDSTGPGYGGGNGNGSGNNTGGHTTSIDMVGLTFSPATDTVTVGSTVTWTNQSSSFHTVTANDGSFSSGQLGDGATYQHTYDTVGSFPYYCQNHGTPTTGMRGVIVVKQQ